MRRYQRCLLLTRTIFENRSRAFTLIEMVMVIGILGICSLAVSRLYMQGVTSVQTQQNHADALWQSRLALARMGFDIRGIRSANDISTATSSQLTFTDVSGNSVSYTLSSSNLLLNGQMLASGVNSLTFTYYDKNGSTTSTIANIRYVRVTLSITKNNTNFSLTTSFYPRALIV